MKDHEDDLHRYLIRYQILLGLTIKYPIQSVTHHLELNASLQVAYLFSICLQGC